MIKHDRGVFICSSGGFTYKKELRGEIFTDYQNSETQIKSNVVDILCQRHK